MTEVQKWQKLARQLLATADRYRKQTVQIYSLAEHCSRLGNSEAWHALHVDHLEVGRRWKKLWLSLPSAILLEAVRQHQKRSPKVVIAKRGQRSAADAGSGSPKSSTARSTKSSSAKRARSKRASI